MQNVKLLSGFVFTAFLIFNFTFYIDGAFAQVSSCRSAQTPCPQGCTLGVNCSSCWTAPTCTITGQTASICGSCACPSDPSGQQQEVCRGACQTSQAGPCITSDGLSGTSDACGTCTADERPPVRLSPYGVEADDQGRPSVWINKTAAGNLVQLQDNGGDRFVVERDGDLRIIGAATGGDIYLNDGKALRIDATGASALNLGNYDSGAGAFHLTLRAGANSLADLILRKGDNLDGSSDRWALAVQSGATDHDFEIRRFRTGAWTTPFSLDYETGNITLLTGATIGGVDLADVITQPTPCAEDQVLQWSGTAWTCANQTGGTTYSGGLNISISPTNTISTLADPIFSTLRVNGSAVFSSPQDVIVHGDLTTNALLVDTIMDVQGASTLAGLTVSGATTFNGNVTIGSGRNLEVAGTIRGNFVATGGAACTGNQILQRSADGATWTCAELPEGRVYSAGNNITISAANVIATAARPIFSGLTINGGVTVDGSLSATGSLIGDDASITGVIRGGSGTFTGALSALSVTATEDVSGRDLIASRDARVTGTGTFDGAVTVNNQLTIANGGNITLGAHRSINLTAPTPDVDNRLNIIGATGAGGGVALRIISPGTANISEVLLRQGATDRWALSARPGSSNFEVWRNNNEGWGRIISASYANDRVDIDHPTFFQDNTVTIGNITGRRSISISPFVDTANARLANYFRILNIDDDDPSPVPQNLIRILDDDEEELFGVIKTVNSSPPGPAGQGDTRIEVNVGQGNNTHGVLVTDELTVNDSMSIDGALSLSTVGLIREVGSRQAGGILQLHVGDASASTLRLDGSRIQTSVGDLNLQPFGGDVRIGGLTAGSTTLSSLTVTGGAAVNGTLTARSTLNANAAANVTGVLDVGGIIRAGTDNVQITSARGGLKMANLANEDWASTLADETDLGWLTIAKNTSATCTVVCTNHGLRCRLAYNITSTGLTETTCGVTRRALCMCGG